MSGENQALIALLHYQSYDKYESDDDNDDDQDDNEDDDDDKYKHSSISTNTNDNDNHDNNILDRNIGVDEAGECSVRRAERVLSRNVIVDGQLVEFMPHSAVS